MYYIDYMSQEFMNYLNRNLTGIILFKDKIKKISIFYFLSEAFSNHACRFYIDIDFFNYDKFTQQEKKKINKYFDNSSNSTGGEFVSFIYKPQKDYHIDIDVVKSFITHYEFAESIFRETVQNILPSDCKLEIQSLEENPFFNYMNSFISYNYYEQEIKSFTHRYKEFAKRDFDFDCIYHNKLKEKAVKKIEENTVSDVEINKAGGGDVDDLRWYILEKDIPFQIRLTYSNVIDEVFIDEKILAEKIKHYNAKNDYKNINVSNILKFIENKVAKRERAEEYLTRKKSELGAEIGDYILIESKNIANENQNIGIIKDITLHYGDELYIKYSILKKDFSESKLPLKEVNGSDISYILIDEIFNKEIQNIQIKPQLIKLFKEKGIKK